MDKTTNLIIYEDAALLVVHKPSGTAPQTSKIGQAALFVGELSFKHPETSQKMDFSINFEEKWNIIQNSENMNTQY
jgi:23S rRNA-/tRNA-specific pseudouridylate synthase